MLEELKRKRNLLWGSIWNVVPLCHMWIIRKGIGKILEIVPFS